MTYTPEQITAHIEHRAHCIGEDSKDVRILRQLIAERDTAREQALRDAAQEVLNENERCLALASIRIPAMASEIHKAILAMIDRIEP